MKKGFKHSKLWMEGSVKVLFEKLICFISYVTKSKRILKKTRSKVKLVRSIFVVITGLLHHFFFISNGAFVHEAFCLMLILNQTLWGKNILHDVLIERDQNITIPLRVGNNSDLYSRYGFQNLLLVASPALHSSMPWNTSASETKENRENFDIRTW